MLKHALLHLFCLIQMEDLLVEPYSFEQGDQIQATVTASNIRGEGTTSTLSSVVVALVQTVPH
jgi:hypothetical protein